MKTFRIGYFLATLPYLIAGILFCSLAIHMHQRLGGWPERIGTHGFAPGLLLHDKIQALYLSYLFGFSIFVAPFLTLVCLIIDRWRFLVPYFLVHIVSLPVFLGLMQLAPKGYLYWWWD